MIKDLKVFDVQIKGKQSSQSFFGNKKGNESLLGELTSSTNKELVQTNRFISDGYIDTYIIKSGQVSLEFKKQLNSITAQTLINLFKDIKNRKLTIFDLTIEQITNSTKEKIIELQVEYSEFLKQQQNLSEFKFKIDKPANLEAFTYFPAFIKNKFQRIKDLERFVVSIPVIEGNESLLGELTSSTNKELVQTNKFISDGYIDNYKIKSGQVSLELKKQLNLITTQTLINLFKDIKNRKLTIFDLTIEQITNTTKENIIELQVELTEFLKQQSNLSEFKFKIDKPANLEAFTYFPAFIKNKFQMIKELERFEVSIPVVEGNENMFGKLISETNQLLQDTNRFISIQCFDTYTIGNLSTKFEYEKEVIVLESLINTFKHLKERKLTVFNLKINEIKNVTKEKIIELQMEFSEFLKLQSNLSEFRFKIHKHMNLEAFTYLPVFIKNKFQMIKDLERFEVQIPVIEGNESLLGELTSETNQLLQDTNRFISEKYFDSYTIGNISEFDYKKDVIALKHLINAFNSNTQMNPQTIQDQKSKLEQKLDRNEINLQEYLKRLKKFKKNLSKQQKESKFTIFNLEINNISNVTEDQTEEFIFKFVQFLKSQENIPKFKFVFKNSWYGKVGLNFNIFPYSSEEQFLMVDQLAKLISKKQSTILNQKEIPLLESWLGQKKITLKCIYKASIDGDSKQNFWGKVNGVANTIAFIQNCLDQKFDDIRQMYSTQVQTRQYKRFGGYRRLFFDINRGGYGEDENAFLFQLDCQEKCFLKKGEEGFAIYDKNDRLFSFGKRDIYIKDGCLNTDDNCSRLGNRKYEAYNYHGRHPWSFLAGSENFQVNELEIFQIDYTEFKYDIDKISMQTLINMFQDLKNKKLTKLDLKIGQVTDFTKELIVELSKEFSEFLKQQSNLSEFRFKIDNPVNLEAFTYFPKFIKNNLQMIKDFKVFDVSIKGKQQRSLQHGIEEGNESLLGELTSSTNKELVQTNRFISDGYIDTYTIKSGHVSLELKKQLNSITAQTLINLFKDIKNRKLTIFDLTIEQITNATKEKIIELQVEFSEFLKQQFRLTQFKFKINEPVNLEAFTYFPEFIKNNLQMIKDMNVFDVLIKGKQEHLSYQVIEEGNEGLLGELTSSTNKELVQTNRFISDGYIDTYTIKSGQVSLELKKQLNLITIQTLINLFKDIKNRKLTIFDLNIEQIMNSTKRKIIELQVELTEFLKQQSNLSEFRFKIDKPANLEAFTYFSTFIKNKFQMITDLERFVVSIPVIEGNKNILGELTFETSQLLQSTKRFISEKYLDTFTIGNLSTKFEYEKDVIILESLINTFKHLKERKLTVFNLKINQIKNATKEKIIELQVEFSGFLKLQYNLSEFRFTIYKCMNLEAFTYLPAFIKNKFQMIKDLERFEVSIPVIEGNESLLGELTSETNQLLQGTKRFISEKYLDTYTIGNLSTKFEYEKDVIELESLINTFKHLKERKLTVFNLKINEIKNVTKEKIIELQVEFQEFLKLQSNLSEFRFKIHKHVNLEAFTYLPAFIKSKFEMIKDLEKFEVSIPVIEGNEKILEELTSETNQLLQDTYRFISEQYFDTYTISNILEFNYKKDVIALESLINTFKHLKKSELTIFNLEINNISNTTQDKIEEFKLEFVEFLKSYKNIYKFRLVFQNNWYEKVGLYFNTFPQSSEEQFQMVDQLAKLISKKQSTILNYNEITLLESWLGQKKITLKCIYKASIDGDRSQDFWRKVNGVANTIAFIQSRQGKRFGGYRRLVFDINRSGYGEDEKAFLFQLDYKEKCILKKGEQGYISDEKNNLLKFGYYDIFIRDGCTNTGDNRSRLGHYSYEANNYHGINQHSFLAGSKNFYVNELEIFQVIH